MRWKVYNKEFRELNGFDVSAFKFKFKITEQIVMEEFTDLICKEGLKILDICNFFLNKGIKFNISLKYIKDIGLKRNLVLYKFIWFIRKEIIRIKIHKFRYNYKFQSSITRKMINRKNRLDFMIKFFNLKNNTIYFVQADSNIWWIPKKIIKNYKNGNKGVSIGWLFMQIGKLKIK